jgi:hypothetical protein
MEIVVVMTVVQLPHPAVPGKTIRGRGLAARKLGKTARALLIADIVEGTVVLSDLSVKQLAGAVGVSVGYASAAIHLTPAEREAVRRGLRPLVQPHAPASPQERLEKIVGEIGLDRTIDLLARTERNKAAA